MAACSGGEPQAHLALIRWTRYALGSMEPKAILPHNADAIKLYMLSVGLRACIQYGDRRKAT